MWNVMYELQKGNYNANTFITMILYIINNSRWLFQSITNRYTWTNSTTDFTINASHPSCKINSVIGLGSDDITSSSLTLELPYVVNFLPLQRMNEINQHKGAVLFNTNIGIIVSKFPNGYFEAVVHPIL